MPIHAPSPASVRGLPMQARIALRDEFARDDSPLAKTVESLATDVGRDVNVRIDWPALWTAASTDAQANHSTFNFKDDPGSFVPLVMDAAREFVGAVASAIEDSEEWGLQLLKEIDGARGGENGGVGVKVVIDPKSKTPSPAWEAADTSLVLRLPPNPAGAAYYVAPGSLRESVLRLWEEGDSTSTLPERPAATGAAPQTSQPSSMSAMNTAAAVHGVAPHVERMPRLNDIPSPAALGEAAVPYWAMLFYSRSRLEFQGTHPPTVNLMIAYMERNLAVNPNTTNKQTFAKMEYIDNALGTGRTGVWLELRSNWGPEPNVVMPLQFLQGALGYRVERTTGSVWILRRDTPFAP